VAGPDGSEKAKVLVPDMGHFAKIGGLTLRFLVRVTAPKTW